MSRDDKIDYRVLYPVGGRNRKRYAENPRKPKEPKKTYGFFTRPTWDERKEKPQSIRRDLGKRYEDDARPRPSLDKMIRTLVAKDLNRSTKSIIAELDSLGYEAAPTTVSMIQQEMMAVLRLCRKHGSIIIPAWSDD
ncbi:hypothetical protein JQ543_30730 [Bradyrhizobium diazoefficiens]|nr:hypothetical protein [Bradyrhizobium diazoefficiens]MBR0852146.1 hypothetical protein [Bradyrhizobium diazoefficiens]